MHAYDLQRIGSGARRVSWAAELCGAVFALAIAGLSAQVPAQAAADRVAAAGDNSYGQLGIGQDTWSPHQTLIDNAVAVAGGRFYSLVLKNEGTVWAWGYNYYGQLGDGTTTNRSVPVQVAGLTGVVAVAGGAYHSLALKNDGTVWAWGANWYGQLGDGTTTDRSTPVQVVGLTGVNAVAGGVLHSLFLGPPLPPRILNAVSRKTHGTAGACDIYVRAAGAVECRKSGPTTLIVVFDRDIQGLGGLDNNDVTLSSGTVSNLSIDFGKQLTVTLSGATNAAPLTVSFPGIADASDPAVLVTDTLCLGVLAGDVNSNGTVSNGDVISVVGKLGQTVNGANFRYDVDCSGKILNGDVISTVGKLGTTASSCP